ncbi:FAD-dependent monooxygenase [Actinacidiphila sp. DG2A-62]|uniref:FAD-dependent monooxygenase n=1 Tax=Actinacidiphila sp. DG2A-62 TaxID=3108821 RepID=UPI002DB68DF8|nr:FAD-dependent monooxygenase [Actinacidiphila sp. DG2A-62]MEC3993762.1 FAD-dependent monooxygenase [Actinacidiphila sp. DG2A-62]
MSTQTRTPPGRTPVLIVGGGPVGLSAALELAFHGVASTVVETRPAVSWQRPRAKTTSARTMEHFRRWGVADALRDRAPLAPAWSDQVVFCTTLLGREVTRFDRCFGLALQHDDLVAEAGQQVPQPLVESVLREAAERHPAVTLRPATTVTALTQDDTGVEAEVQDADGHAWTVRADYALGCDGARSMVREVIGAALQGSDDSRPNYNVVFRAPDLDARTAHGNAVQYWVLDPARPGVLGRLDLADLWWGIAVGVDADEGAADPLSLVRGLIGDPRGEVPVEILAGDPWRARMQLADRFGAGRVFLAGDAAHLNPPWGGHGYNTGIGDAVNIGWKLAAVLNGWAPPALLDSYESERRPVAAATIAAATANMTTLAAELADPRLTGTDEEFAEALPAVRDAVLRTKDAEFHSLPLVLGTAYPRSPIVVPDRDGTAVSGADAAAGTGVRTGTAAAGGEGYVPVTAAGHRLPHRWLSPTESLYDRLGPEYTLLGDQERPAARRLRDAALSRGVPLRCVEDPGAGEPPDGRLVLVRPDQHIAWCGTEPGDPDALWDRVLGHQDQGHQVEGHRVQGRAPALRPSAPPAERTSASRD